MLKFLKDLLGIKPPAKEKPEWYPVVCPFCFSKFHPDEVVFRATHHQPENEDYCLQEDEKLNRYREKFGLAPVQEIEAVIAPGSIPVEKRGYSGKVLVYLVDNYEQVTRKRLCPHCHNELPLTAGKVPSNIISIVGASQVGKSVYMTSLIHTLQNVTAANFNAACKPLNTEISRRFRQTYEEPLFERGSVLGITQVGERQEPYIFDFQFKEDDSVPPLTLVFFDAAGEGMVSQEYMDVYASHIKNSSGILFMVDPLQIKTIRDRILVKLNADSQQGDVSNRYDEPRDVLLAMYQNFIGHEDKGKTDIPTAVVLTKSDMLQYLKEEDGEYIRSNSNVFHNFVHSRYLNLTEYENINGEISRFIDKVDRPFKDAIDVTFTTTSYFAVSALGSNPVDKKIAGVINPIRVDEPFIWLLYKLGYIEGREGN